MEERGKRRARDHWESARPVSLLPDDLVTTTLAADQTLPLVVTPALAGVDLAEWAGGCTAWIERLLLTHGAILFRGFALDTQAAFAGFVRRLAPELMDYLDQHTPRTALGGKGYTSTDYPSGERIELHSEMSYSPVWPKKIWFFCAQPARQGGETPIADNRRVLALIDPHLRGRFSEKGVMYIRNYGLGVGLPWQTAFQTGDRAAVEEFCRRGAVECTWQGEDRLRTTYVGQAVASHPVTGDSLWFNQAHAFHPASMSPTLRTALLAALTEDELPSNVRYGDGSPITDSEIDLIRQAYARATVSFSWQKGDVLMLDNMLAAHGRAPFSGERKIVVAMAEPHRGGGLA